MKQKYIYLLGMIIVTGISLSWYNVTKSNSLDPQASKYANQCATGGRDSAGEPEYNKCCIDYNEAISAAEKDWETNLNLLVDQEKPASQMVDDAYENLRTYNCWLEYICRAVQYSGYAPIQSAYGTGLTSAHLGQVPGCQLPEDLKMEANFNEFTQAMKKVPLLGSAIVAKENLYVNNKLNFFPSCMSDPINNQSPNVSIANANFQACKVSIEEKFGCNQADVLADPVKFKRCLQGSNAIVKMETALKKSSADQKASALERKLSTIVTKLAGMEEHVGYLSNFLKQLDGRLACIANQCT